MDPATIMMLLTAIGSGIEGYAGQQSAENQAAANRAMTEAQHKRQIAFQESELDPFRQQMSQAKDLFALDKLANADFTPTSVTAAAPYAKYVPKVSGGFSYTKSPALKADAQALFDNVAGGNTAPSMTDPQNYGRTATLDLVTLLGQKAGPGAGVGVGYPGLTESKRTPPAGAPRDGWALPRFAADSMTDDDLANYEDALARGDKRTAIAIANNATQTKRRRPGSTTGTKATLDLGSGW